MWRRGTHLLRASVSSQPLSFLARVMYDLTYDETWIKAAFSLAGGRLSQVWLP